MATLKTIAGLPGGEVVFDDSNPIVSVDDARRCAAMNALEMKVASAGEIIVSRFATSALHKKLTELGSTRIEDFGPQELADLFAPGAPRPASNRAGALSWPGFERPRRQAATLATGCRRLWESRGRFRIGSSP